MFNLGRRAIRRTSVTAVPAEDVEKKKGQHTVPTTKADSAPEQPKSSAMATQTSTSIAALTLARTNTSKVASFLGQGNITGSGQTPSGRTPGGGPPGGPPGTGGSGGGGFPSGGPPGGGGPGIGGGATPGAGGANSKLGGNPPTDFDGTRALADQFMQEFNLYRLTNIDTEQMVSPMKRAALLLGFIKGPNVKDWVKRWTNWIINEMNTGRVHMDEHYWTEISHAFQQAFQDTGAREQVEDKIRRLEFIPNKVDSFIAQFKGLAAEATYPINAQSTLSLFASKLPFRMMDHIYKVIRPINFQGWADGVRQFHQDNTAVQNIRGIYKDMPKKRNSKVNPYQLAKVLGVKMPSPNPNAMDTQADCTQSSWNRNKTKARTSITNSSNSREDQMKTGCCFTCNKQGHLSRNCPDKPDIMVKKSQAKARTAKADEDVEEDDTESSYQESGFDKFIKQNLVLNEIIRTMSTTERREMVTHTLEEYKKDGDEDF
ncbi:hypothetical protein EDB83DRAFT_2520577 [Lactarius deliciosus]|nr:hypothetical protein EDB83DRAFT_2520577 [Lactarius deliciosus]